MLHADDDRVFETYWTTVRGSEAMDYSYAVMDLTVYGRQETWEDSPPVGRSGAPTRVDRPPARRTGPRCQPGRRGARIAQWSRLTRDALTTLVRPGTERSAGGGRDLPRWTGEAWVTIGGVEAT